MKRLGEEKFCELFIIGTKKASEVICEFNETIRTSVAMSEKMKDILGNNVTLHVMSAEEKSEALASLTAGVCTTLIGAMLKGHGDATTPQEADAIFVRIFEGANA